MSYYDKIYKRKRRIRTLENHHYYFYLAHVHDAHVIDWYAARPEIIRSLRSAGKSDQGIGTIFALSVSHVRRIAKDVPNASVLEFWRKKREDAIGKLQWHSELPGQLAIILEDLGMQSKDDCHILASDSFETYRSSIRIKDQLIPLKMLNHLRAWIGVAAYAPSPRMPTHKEIAKAMRILALANNVPS